MFKRDAFADIFAMITFGIVVGMSVELMAGLTFTQSLKSRLISIPVNTIIARPYGIYRDWLMAKSTFLGQGFLQASLTDVFAFVSFQIPVYSTILFLTGASTEQVVSASIGQISVMLIMGRPYGLWMQRCRTWFNKPVMPTAA